MKILYYNIYITDINQKSKKMSTTPPPLGKIVSKSSRSSRMRNINAKISNLSLGSTVNINSELSSKAGRNGGGFVFHRSNCGYPNVRMYCCGGDGPSSACGYWVDTLTPYSIRCRNYNDPVCEGYWMTYADIVWYGAPNDSYASIRNTINKDTSVDFNWDIESLVYFATMRGASRPY
jgi:hypothetical protein